MVKCLISEKCEKIEFVYLAKERVILSFNDPHLDGEVERENGGRRAKAAGTAAAPAAVNISGKDGIGKRADMKGNHSQGGALSTNCRPVLSPDHGAFSVSAHFIFRNKVKDIFSLRVARTSSHALRSF